MVFLPWFLCLFKEATDSTFVKHFEIYSQRSGDTVVLGFGSAIHFFSVSLLSLYVFPSNR